MKKKLKGKKMKGLVLILVLLSFSVILVGQTQTYGNPDLILHIAPEDSLDGFGSPKAFGYFNNDNYEDLVVLAPNFINSQGQKVGKAYLYYGSTTGIDTLSVIEIEGIYAESYVGIYKITIGDYNNDGYDDLALGNPWYQKSSTTARGYTMVILSNSDGSGLNLEEYMEFIGYSSYGTFGNEIRTADVNGDNVDDLIIAAIYDSPWGDGRIYVYYGDSMFNNTYDKNLSLNGSTAMGRSVAIGDINGDGFDDIISQDIPGWNTYNSRTHIFFGASDMNTTPTFTKYTAPFTLTNVANDTNNDGFDDIFLSYYSNSQTSPDIKIMFR